MLQKTFDCNVACDTLEDDPAVDIYVDDNVDTTDRKPKGSRKPKRGQRVPKRGKRKSHDLMLVTQDWSNNASRNGI